MTPEQLAKRRRLNRRILMFLVGPIGLFLLWIGTFGLWPIALLGVVFIAFAVGAYFAKT